MGRTRKIYNSQLDELNKLELKADSPLTMRRNIEEFGISFCCVPVCAVISFSLSLRRCV